MSKPYWYQDNSETTVRNEDNQVFFYGTYVLGVALFIMLIDFLLGV